MAKRILAGPLGPTRAASTAAGGTALTTTAGFIAFPLGARTVLLTPRNFVTAVVCQYIFNPWLTVLKTADLLVTNPTDASNNMQDGSTATTLVLNSLDTFANGDAVYVGADTPFRGARAIIGNTNGTPSVLTVKYWNGTAWTTTSATDGTDSPVGTTLGVTGNVSWTVPTDWARVGLLDAADTALRIGWALQKLYWTRWEVSVALDTTVTLTGLLAMNRSTAYGELLSGQPFEQNINQASGGFGCVEALVDAGTGNLIVNVAASHGGDFA